MKYNPQIHNRRSIRLKGYDYTQAGMYFLTLCVQNRAEIFGEIQNGQMQLNTFGKIAKEEWKKTAEIRKNVSLGEYIIMPNHFHAILHIDYPIKSKENNIGHFKSPSHTIGAIVRGYKGATTKKTKEIIRNEDKVSSSKGELQFAPTAPTALIDLSKSIWQRNYWEHIIRDENAYHRISQYIINNPQKWEEDRLNNGPGNIVLEPPIEYGKEKWMV